MSLFRSWMFVPGNSERRLAKVDDLTADVIIFDLEDAVPLSEKQNARQLVCQTIRNSRAACSFVRVNDLASGFFADDIADLAGVLLAGIVLPKANSRQDILTADQALAEAESKSGRQLGDIEIVPLIESALGLYQAFEIAASSPRVKRLAFGSVDFTLDIQAQLTHEGTEILYARSHLVVVSRAAGIEPPIDAVFVQMKDREGLLRDTKLAKQLGFQGKMVIHPDQIGIVNDVFTPTQEEIEEAKRIVSAFDEALLEGSAAIQLDGKMIDYPVAERAKRIVRQAEFLQRNN
ncbi:HpcH/HpaI aldolase/citrate lyase family protein [Effusibacillus dendaii]|uniref:Citrate lyase n=1 Tax=Effusibacillus dendaii TaxID=2743772 RepID=A0A7I8D8B9_9BACL|nr:CoA ester lyase [Effusibacillus dendaii]BCJ86388.1 citrate lyase [Effusibacillus dendaii]